jgi:hypothetical protein
MKLKAPAGVGDPCVAGVAILPRDGLYEVEDDIGALLMECFGFVEVVAEKNQNAASTTPRQPVRPPKLAHPAWRSPPVAKKP